MYIDFDVQIRFLIIHVLLQSIIQSAYPFKEQWVPSLYVSCEFQSRYPGGVSESEASSRARESRGPQITSRSCGVIATHLLSYFIVGAC